MDTAILVPHPSRRRFAHTQGEVLHDAAGSTLAGADGQPCGGGAQPRLGVFDPFEAARHQPVLTLAMDGKAFANTAKAKPGLLHPFASIDVVVTRARRRDRRVPRLVLI